jgi:hypothetical protein
MEIVLLYMIQQTPQNAWGDLNYRGSAQVIAIA